MVRLTATLSARADAELARRFRERAAREGLTVSALLRQLAARFLDEDLVEVPLERASRAQHARLQLTIRELDGAGVEPPDGYGDWEDFTRGYAEELGYGSRSELTAEEMSALISRVDEALAVA